MNKNLKIAVAGTGYVGLSIATLLSQHHEVWAVDIIPEKVDLINRRKSPIQDEYIEKYLAEKPLNLTATLDAEKAYTGADFVVIAAPTNYDSKTQHFDTSAVEAVIKLVMQYNPDAIMVIKSTIPVGYTASVREKFGTDNILFSPEFLRESKALYDNLYPIAHHRGHRPERRAPCGGGPHLCGPFTGGCHQGKRRHAVHGLYRGRGRQAVCQHLSGAACGLLQRAGHLRRDARVWTPGRSSTASAWTRASAAITTIPASATAATACPRTPNNCWRTTPMCRKT